VLTQSYGRLIANTRGARTCGSTVQTQYLHKYLYDPNLRDATSILPLIYPALLAFTSVFFLPLLLLFALLLLWLCEKDITSQQAHGIQTHTIQYTLEPKSVPYMYQYNTSQTSNPLPFHSEAFPKRKKGPSLLTVKSTNPLQHSQHTHTQQALPASTRQKRLQIPAADLFNILVLCTSVRCTGYGVS